MNALCRLLHRLSVASGLLVCLFCALQGETGMTVLFGGYVVWTSRLAGDA